MDIAELEHIHYGYVVGIGRSGTTLLSKLLNQHKNCLLTVEIEFIIFFKHHFEKKTNFSKEDIELIVDFFQTYADRDPLYKLIVHPEKLRNDLLNIGSCNYFTLTKFIHSEFNFYKKPLADLKWIIDKNPSYTLHIDKLGEFSPYAKFIWMIRDYRANILSRKQSIEFRSPKVAFNCYRWLFYNKKALRSSKSKKGIYLLKYEDLVSDPVHSMQKICNVLEISNREDDLKFYSYQTPPDLNIESFDVKRERYAKTFSDIEKPVFTNRINAWKEELPNSEIKICEAICGKFAEEFGYKQICNLSVLRKMTIRLSVFDQYIWALYDYYKEFVLYYFSPAIKLKRIHQKSKKK